MPSGNQGKLHRRGGFEQGIEGDRRLLGRQGEGRASQGAEASCWLDVGKGRRQEADLKIRGGVPWRENFSALVKEPKKD